VDACVRRDCGEQRFLYQDKALWMADSVIRHASAGSIICSSAPATDAYLMFGLAEAKALILQHRVAVLAIAEAPMTERTLNSDQFDTIIAAAPERIRRSNWKFVEQSADDFAFAFCEVERSSKKLKERMPISVEKPL
jgi:hypothetical protein